MKTHEHVRKCSFFRSSGQNHGQKGVAMVEFAIIVPLLLVLTFGIIEFALLMYNKQVITNASREGARYGIVSQTPRATENEIAARVGNYTKDRMISFGTYNPPGITTNAQANASFGDELLVEVNFDYGFLIFPKVVSLLPGSSKTLSPVVSLKARTLMMYE